MNREIKFRGRRLDNGEFVYGSFTHCQDENGNKTIIPFRANYFVPVDHKTVGQCIGLKDCDGKEIYESDIVSSGNSDYVVVWSPEHAQFFFSVINTKTTLVRNLKFPVFQYAIDGVCGVEVIGNIYENPELLEKL